jgi:pimeloyl-ACP methyl ester carboxylesterase
VFPTPTWSLVHSRHWTMQIPYLARHFRVLTMDGLGNGRSDRCRDPRRYGAAEFALDCLAVMDATGTERAMMVSPHAVPHTRWSWRISPLHRGRRRCLHRPVVPLHPVALVVCLPPRAGSLFQRRLHVYRWWARMNAAHWRQDYPKFANPAGSLNEREEPNDRRQRHIQIRRRL